MQFIHNGPDIPERLLQAHEEGRVIFFCGSGISYPARLPGFDGLVAALCKKLAITPNAIQQAAIKAKQFDTAIGLLEADIVGGREAVRRAVADILTPDLTAPQAMATHEALLILARNRDSRIRLITTNFDRLFEEVVTLKSLLVDRYKAPLLPLPKTRLDGLIYLHGLLSPTPTLNELDCLVLSSGDFGLAYLTERWAARFVGELFRKYTVCFVGYSINDPVLRYMMDALAADRLLGESPPEMFAFGSYSKGKEDERANEWRAKNVTPILYREYNRHTYLHRTLRVWADTYRDGLRGKERIVIECAMGRPLASTKQDDFVGRLLWALSDPHGLPAKSFADLDPVPSLDWLEPLSDMRYRHADLTRFGIQPKSTPDEKLQFSLTYRPSPYNLAPYMSLVHDDRRGNRWDEVMGQLARWLMRHLNDPRLLLWIVKQGGLLSDDLKRWIERRLEDLDRLERTGNTTELAHIRSNAPNAIPNLHMRTLWRLLLTGRVRVEAHEYQLYNWQDRFKRDGFTAALRLELREMLMPHVSLQKPLHLFKEFDDEQEPNRISDLVEWEIILSTDNVHHVLRDISSHPEWNSVLKGMLLDFSGLLRDTLDLMKELGSADYRSDLSYIHHPSISEHPQNNDFNDWTALINLTRDAWLVTVSESVKLAQLTAEMWWLTPYPLFKRLALFAAAQDSIISATIALEWILADEHWWLWSVETEREVMRLLVSIAPRLTAIELKQLEEAIHSGPPRIMYIDDLEPERWIQIHDRAMWERLTKINIASVELNESSIARLFILSTLYPTWQLAPDERDEFPHWVESGNVGDRDPWRTFTSIPRSRRGILSYLLENPTLEDSKQDDWRKRCGESFQATAYALCNLARSKNNWPSERWRDALQAWSDDKLKDQSWRYMGPVLAAGPDELLNSLTHSISWWMRSIAKTINVHEETFLDLATRILNLEYADEIENEDPVGRAINHPVGQITESLLNWLYKTTPEDNQGLPDILKAVFTDICNINIAKFSHGRVLLAANVITLFRVDRNWTTLNLLPLFDWQLSPTVARSVWEGFLWSPRLYKPLFEVLKPTFLNTSRYYTKLGKHSRQYASLLTFAALDPGDTFTIAELSNATRALPLAGLKNAAQSVVIAIEGAGENSIDYWKNRVVPYLHEVWPKTKNTISPQISESFSRLCISAKEMFPDALTRLRPWLQHLDSPHYVVHKLNESGICSQYPEYALDFLRLIIGDQSQWVSRDLGKCLEAIRNTNPLIVSDTRYEWLLSYLQKH